MSFLFFLLLASFPLFWLLAALIHMMRVAEGIPRLRPGQGPPEGNDLPAVSVIVPARNEESRIGDCLRSLLRQDYPKLEILVVDDCSTDRTAEVVQEIGGRDERVRLIRGRTPPPGWLGKPHAIWQGVANKTFYDQDRTNYGRLRNKIDKIISKMFRDFPPKPGK